MSACTALFAQTLYTPSLKAESSDRPNIVLILADDQGYADLGCFGGKHVKTPRIDRMAAEGARLTSFYVAGSVCTPSRAALMTGCYPKRNDMAGGVFLAADARGLNPNEITIAEVLKSAGYKTGMFGKWHLGDQPEFLPTRQGFDEYFGIPYSHDIHPFHGNNKKYHFPPLPLLEMETVIELEPDASYLTQRLTKRAVQFIEANKDKPFFLYLPHPIPHRPLHVSPEFVQDVPEAIKAKLAEEKISGKIDYKTRDKIYKQAISEIDWSVGRILDSLKAQGIDDNTLVIFTSDNGPKIGKAAPLKGGKGSTFEGGMRMPAVIRWPGKIPAGTVNGEIMTAMDLLPTFANLAGAEIPSDRVIDGKDIWPVLNRTAKSPHEAFFYYSKNDLKAVRSDKWKLHLGSAKGEGSAALYNLEIDIGEKINVLADHPAVEKRLLALVADFQTELTQNSRPAGFVENPKSLTKPPANKQTQRTQKSQPPIVDPNPAPVVDPGILYRNTIPADKITSTQRE
nr:sulfatase [Novipirellula aureliae]